MADDEVALQFDDLLLVGRGGEVLLEGPERLDRGHVTALGAEADRDRQGLE